MAVLAVALNGVALPLALLRMNGAAMLALRGNAVVGVGVALALLVVTVSVAAKPAAGGIVALACR